MKNIYKLWAKSLVLKKISLENVLWKLSFERILKKLRMNPPGMSILFQKLTLKMFAFGSLSRQYSMAESVSKGKTNRDYFNLYDRVLCESLLDSLVSILGDIKMFMPMVSFLLHQGSVIFLMYICLPFSYDLNDFATRVKRYLVSLWTT